MFVFVKQSAVILQTPGSYAFCFLWWFWLCCWSLCCCSACRGTTKVCCCDLSNVPLSLPHSDLDAAYFSSRTGLHLHDNGQKQNIRRTRKLK